MKPIRHRSPKTQNNLSNNYFKSPKRKEINIINFNNRGVISSQKNCNINNNQFNYYSSNSDNCYEEITKAFKFITFILKQKDNQIKQLKTKIEQLQKQLNDINETNIMTFNNKDIMEFTTNDENFNITNSIKSSFKHSSFNSIQNRTKFFSNGVNDCKYNQLTNNFSSTDIGSKYININKNNNVNNNIKNHIINKSNHNFDNSNNNINIIHKIKNSTNINKINNYRDSTEKRNNDENNQNANNYISNFTNSEPMNKQANISMNANINEYSSEKDTNLIRKEPYHTNYNINLRNRNEFGKKLKNYGTDTDSGVGTEKIKIVTLENSMNNQGKFNSNSNSLNLSEDGNIIQSKIEVKNYLKEIKTKLEPLKFKKFITNIKALIKNKNNGQKNVIIYEIKNLLVDKNLITKFENIMKIK